MRKGSKTVTPWREYIKIALFQYKKGIINLINKQKAQAMQEKNDTFIY